MGWTAREIFLSFAWFYLLNSLTVLWLRLLAEDAKRHFSAFEILVYGTGIGRTNDERVHDAGDVVADVFIAGERRQSAEIGVPAGAFGIAFVFAIAEVIHFFVIGLLPCAEAALHGRIVIDALFPAHD